MPKPTDDEKTYTFKIRRGVQFSDGTELTAHDIVATYQKIIFPPQGVASARKAFYVMVDSVTAPDPYTVVFKLKYPSGAFIPALAVITSYSIHYTKLYEAARCWPRRWHTWPRKATTASPLQLI